MEYRCKKKVNQIVLMATFVSIAAGQCFFPDELLGEWTSSNYGKLTFSNSTPQFIMSFGVVKDTSSTSFNCLLIDGTQYILKSLTSVEVFSGTSKVFAYLCLDLRKSGLYSYYYYQNSGKEVGFFGQRIVGLNELISSVNVSEVCTTTLDPAEFHTMVKVGFESEAAIQCADPLLISATYTYTDSTGTYCSGLNTTLVDSCNNNLTTLQFNDSVVSDADCQNKNPGFSTSGALGCVANVYDSNTTQYYVSLYNYDATVSAPTYRFTCVAVKTDVNGTVLMSLSHTDCEAGQSATVLPTDGALMQMQPYCVPVDDSSKDWTWLIWLCIGLFCFILCIIVIVLLCIYIRHRKRKRARRKEMLASDTQLREMSLRLDLEKVPDADLLEMRKRMYASNNPRERKKEKLMMNPMTEPSLKLNFKTGKWTGIKNPISTITEDPFNETSKDEHFSESPIAHKATESLRNSRQRSFVNGTLKSADHNPLMNGGLPNRHSVSNGTYIKSEPTLQNAAIEMSQTERASAVNRNHPHTDKSKTPNKTFEKNKMVESDYNSSTTSKTERDFSVKTVASSRGNINAQKRAPSVRSNRSLRSSNTPNIKSWTSKRLNRSKSNVGDKFGRGLTNTRLGSVTKRQTSRSEEMVQRSQSFVESPQSAVERFGEEEKLKTTAMNDLVSAETGEKETVSNTNKPTEIKSILKKTSAYLPVETGETADGPRFPHEPQIPDEFLDTEGYTDSEMLSATLDFGSSQTSSTFQSYLGARTKSELSKKMNIPKASKAPWR